ncbi:hypothetical protein [Pannonibacter sp. SL95]|uniref:hypothetical protein n=1 Tax=Pannonibacter sp. SL95 TaxID=2995153 RepID=UPI002274971B|nr:hypothetical protein [Pannonibacter sp. SL95]MCY1707332.1 hypothetical protein [Pannonibacter sp. SL95]
MPADDLVEPVNEAWLVNARLVEPAIERQAFGKGVIDRGLKVLDQGVPRRTGNNEGTVMGMVQKIVPVVGRQPDLLPMEGDGISQRAMIAVAVIGKAGASCLRSTRR